MNRGVDATDPLLVTLGFDPSTFSRLDALRSRHFPPERNIVPAHLSLFHHLPWEEREAIEQSLSESASTRGPLALHFPSLKKTGRGFGATVEAPGLATIHARLSREFAPWLTPQDRQPFRPHVTLMNKAEPIEASLAFAGASAGWEPWSGWGDALLLWRYRGGPWERVARFPFEAISGTTE